MAAGGREIVAQDLGDILCRHLAPVGPSGFAKAENITASVGRHGPAVGEAGIDLTLAVIADEPLRGRIEQRGVGRSEERRVGQECVRTCRSRWSTYHYKKNKVNT